MSKPIQIEVFVMDGDGPRTIHQQLFMMYKGITSTLEALRTPDNKIRGSKDECELYENELKALMDILDRMNNWAKVRGYGKEEDETEAKVEGDDDEDDDNDGTETITATA